MTLLEKYSKRLAVAEKLYSKDHNGARLTEAKKLMTAKCIDNVSRFLSEALDNSVGTQRLDMGLWKKFSINLTTVLLPNLIAPELVLVSPMSSMSGYVTYLNYTAGSDKGNVVRGDVFNGVYALDPQNKFQNAEYTSNKVTTTGAKLVETTATVGDITAASYVPFNWSPVIPGSVVVKVGSTTYQDDSTGALWIGGTRTEVVDSVTGKHTVTVDGGAAATEAAAVLYGTTRDGRFDSTAIPAGIYFTDDTTEEEADVSYLYGNIYVPQNDIPLLNAKVEAIPLIARLRRIAVYYSQMAAFQAKTDYGFDLGDQLAEQAVGQLSYEIDTEVVQLLTNSAEHDSALDFNKTMGVGVSKAEWYEGFLEVLGIAKQKIYDRTKKFVPNYMVISSSVLPLLGFIKTWTPAPASQINGPYFAGTLENMKVFVSPAMAPDEYVLGVNGSDMMTSALVYAPYMPIVPTQLLQYADGGTSQGFSTLYDLKLLSTYVSAVDGKTYSPLLVKGKITTNT